MDKDKSPEEIISDSENLTTLSDAIARLTRSPSMLDGILSVADALHQYQEQNISLIGQLTHAVSLFEDVNHQMDLSEIIGLQSSALDIAQQVRNDSLEAFSTELVDRLSTQIGAPDFLNRSLPLRIAQEIKEASLSAFSTELSEQLSKQLMTPPSLEAELPILSIVDRIREESLLGLSNDFSAIVNAQSDAPSIFSAGSSVSDLVGRLKDDSSISPATDLHTLLGSYPDLLNTPENVSSVFGIVDRVQKISLGALSANLSLITESPVAPADILSFQSPAFDRLQAATHSAASLFDYGKSISELAAQNLPVVNPQWLSQITQVIPFVEPSLRLDPLLRPHLAGVSELSILAQANAARLPWDRLGSSIELGDSGRSAIRDNFFELAGSYSTLFGFFEQEPLNLASLPPIASGLPPVELFNETNFIGAITYNAEEYSALYGRTQRIGNEIKAETTEVLDKLLRELGEDLLELWKGARHALDAHNPDHVRHFATSFRELFNHVLHLLAPDNAIRQWTANPDHFQNNRPTRTARLLYICRNVNYGPFTDFVEHDIKAMLSLVELFQSGTHKISSGYTRQQLSAMAVRMESSLRFIIEVGRSII